MKPVAEKQISFTQGQANDIIQLIDLAVKAGGLNVAEVASFYHKKFKEAFEEKPVTEPAPTLEKV